MKVRITLTRWGTCKHFINHTCPRNDLYLHPEIFVQTDFAVKCNLYLQGVFVQELKQLDVETS